MLNPLSVSSVSTCFDEDVPPFHPSNPPTHTVANREFEDDLDEERRFLEFFCCSEFIAISGESNIALLRLGILLFRVFDDDFVS